MAPNDKSPHPSAGKERRKGKRLRASETSVPMAAANMRIGLLGGSFNPAHEGHLHISLVALKRLGLDQIWWLVTPGNPLKGKVMLPELAKRVAAAREIARHPRIVVTGFEAAQGSAYTIGALRFLKRRFPNVSFVWLMGADNLPSFHRWRAWEELFGMVPIAVLDRPGFRLRARASRAAQRFARAEIDESDAPGLASLKPPAWTLLTLPLSSLSSTALRDGNGDKRPKAETGQAKTATGHRSRRPSTPKRKATDRERSKRH
jgi:nicotinate-nucleotide adenylyltransferase